MNYSWTKEQSADAIFSDQRSHILGYNLYGLNLKKMDKLDSKQKSLVVTRLSKMPYFKEYMLEVMEDVYGVYWFIVLPITAVMYLLQRRAINKYLDKNQEYLI